MEPDQGLLVAADRLRDCTSLVHDIRNARDKYVDACRWSSRKPDSKYREGIAHEYGVTLKILLLQNTVGISHSEAITSYYAGLIAARKNISVKAATALIEEGRRKSE